MDPGFYGEDGGKKKSRRRKAPAGQNVRPEDSHVPLVIKSPPGRLSSHDSSRSQDSGKYSTEAARHSATNLKDGTKLHAIRNTYSDRIDELSSINKPYVSRSPPKYESPVLQAAASGLGPQSVFQEHPIRLFAKSLRDPLYTGCLNVFRAGLQHARGSGLWNGQQIFSLTNALSRLHAWGEDISADELESCTLRSQALLTGVTEILIDLAEALQEAFEHFLVEHQDTAFHLREDAQASRFFLIVYILRANSTLSTSPRSEEEKDPEDGESNIKDGTLDSEKTMLGHEQADPPESEAWFRPVIEGVEEGETRSELVEDIVPLTDLLCDLSPTIECILAEEAAPPTAPRLDATGSVMLSTAEPAARPIGQADHRQTRSSAMSGTSTLPSSISQASTSVTGATALGSIKASFDPVTKAQYTRTPGMSQASKMASISSNTAIRYRGGSCKYSHLIRKKGAKAGLGMISTSMYSEKSIYTCKSIKCSFGIGGIKTQKGWEIDSAVHTSSGIQYRWLFLAKSHVQVPIDSSKAHNPYKCLICLMLESHSETWLGVDELFAHISSEHRGTKIGDVMLEGPLTFNNRGAHIDENFDIHLPATGSPPDDLEAVKTTADPLKKGLKSLRLRTPGISSATDPGTLWTHRTRVSTRGNDTRLICTACKASYIWRNEEIAVAYLLRMQQGCSNDKQERQGTR